MTLHRGVLIFYEQVPRSRSLLFTNGSHAADTLDTAQLVSDGVVMTAGVSCQPDRAR